jgi:hypothetical protein
MKINSYPFSGSQIVFADRRGEASRCIFATSLYAVQKWLHSGILCHETYVS